MLLFVLFIIFWSPVHEFFGKAHSPPTAARLFAEKKGLPRSDSPFLQIFFFIYTAPSVFLF